MAAPATGIIDAHVHLYPAEMAADPSGWARRMGEPLWEALVAERPDRRVRQGWADADRLLRDMDAAGVERAVLLGWYWEQHATCVWQNRYYAQCVRAHPDRLSAFATVQASAGAAALAEIDRAAADGLIGLGELCPWAFGVAPLAGGWEGIFGAAVERNWPVTLHVADPAARPYPGRLETPWADVLALARRFPDLRLILAHWGGGLALHELNGFCRDTLRAACFDTAATPLLYDRRIYALAAQIVGAGRILFGSDYPLLVHKAQGEPELARGIAEVRAAGLEPATAAQILGENARRVILRS